MHIKKLDITNFRVFEKQELLFIPGTNIFIGNNAQGKTTILEAIYVLALTKSHRINKDKDLLKYSADFAKINGLIGFDDKDIELSIIISKLGKKAKYNQIELERLSEYVGLLNVVIFAPEDLELIKGNPSSRRQFFDLEIGQISNDYLIHLQNYRKILKQRNDLLKTMQKHNDKNFLLLDIVTDQLITEMVEIIEYRTHFLCEINNYANSIYKRLSGGIDELNINYIQSVSKEYKKEFSDKYQYDIITGTTNLGIHRDDIEIHLNDNLMKINGSQGEQRTAVLAVKLALVEYIKAQKNHQPILLLDDVLSELDENRQNSLLDYIENTTQTFITATNINDIQLDKITNYKIFHLEDGLVKESETHE